MVMFKAVSLEEFTQFRASSMANQIALRYKQLYQMAVVKWHDGSFMLDNGITVHQIII